MYKTLLLFTVFDHYIVRNHSSQYQDSPFKLIVFEKKCLLEDFQTQRQTQRRTIITSVAK